MIKLVEIYNIVLEGAFDSQGIADKAYEKFHIPTDAENLKAHAALQRELNGRPVGRIKGVYIFLNPKGLQYFGKDVRAIGDIHGNLYVAQQDGQFNHVDMGEALGIDLYNTNDHIRLYRMRNGNKFHDVSTLDDIDNHREIIRAIRNQNPKIDILSRFK